ncbi:unnamed protein product [Pedinophyceae sp. YPF-701]|nr:unnamed protein product [Pedinophyceae sp. YPF-701]
MADLEDFEDLTLGEVGELARESHARERRFREEGFREGTEEGLEQTVQTGFNLGFVEGSSIGLAWGYARARLLAKQLLDANAGGAPRPPDKEQPIPVPCQASASAACKQALSRRPLPGDAHLASQLHQALAEREAPADAAPPATDQEIAQAFHALAPSGGANGSMARLHATVASVRPRTAAGTGAEPPVAADSAGPVTDDVAAGPGHDGDASRDDFPGLQCACHKGGIKDVIDYLASTVRTLEGAGT